MYYLTCSNCNHSNEIKTEYLVFCSNCNKKLDNNFSDWIKHNMDKSFDDYKQTVCSIKKVEFSLKEPKRKGKGTKYWLGFSVAFVLCYVLLEFGEGKLVGLLKKPLFDKVLMQAASEVNKICPFMVDKATRLDNAIALPDNVFQYNYTLITMLKDSVNVKDLENYLKPTITNFVKTNPEMKKMRENNVTFNYYYKDKMGVYLFTISVKPELYKN